MIHLNLQLDDTQQTTLYRFIQSQADKEDTAIALMQEGLYATVRKLYETEYEAGTMTLNAIATELNISLLVLYDILRTLNLPLIFRVNFKWVSELSDFGRISALLN